MSIQDIGRLRDLDFLDLLRLLVVLGFHMIIVVSVRLENGCLMPGALVRVRYIFSRSM